MARLVVFTDLDGTLLSHDSYDWRPARPALAALQHHRIPLVLTSSKTRRELERWRARLGQDGPFISENGSALYVPIATGSAPPAGAEQVDGYWRVELGTPWAVLREALGHLSRDLGVPLLGFGDLDSTQVARLTGLGGEDLAAAMAREYDEPFVPARPLEEDTERRLAELAAGWGLRVTRGGRFYHLLGPVSKADAAGRLVAGAGAPVTTVAVGDSPNDLELLAWADYAVVVARPDGSHAPELRQGVPDAHFTQQAGPKGFADGVIAILTTLGYHPK
jgi:mannosyl-3-phosphoglycerate phosphatase